MEKSLTAAVGAAPQKGWTALVTALTLALMLALSACSSEREAAQEKPYPPANPLFYELANSDGEVEGWLLGTIHALHEGVEWRTPEIDRVVDEADLLLVEVAGLGQSDTIRRTFLELSQTAGLSPIEERVAAQLRPDAEAIVTQSNFSRAHLRTTEDWAAAIMLSQVDAPGEPKYGVDRAVIADFEGRRVRGFETAESQLGIFDRLAADDQRTLLEGTIEEWSSSKDNPERLLRAWLSGDTQVLEDATSEGIMADPELRAALLVDRNSDWMRQLRPMLDNDPQPLIAVGAAHLVGSDGLVAMLQKQGYTVTRL